MKRVQGDLWHKTTQAQTLPESGYCEGFSHLSSLVPMLRQAGTRKGLSHRGTWRKVHTGPLHTWHSLVKPKSPGPCELRSSGQVQVCCRETSRSCRPAIRALEKLTFRNDWFQGPVAWLKDQSSGPLKACCPHSGSVGVCSAGPAEGRPRPHTLFSTVEATRSGSFPALWLRPRDVLVSQSVSWLVS